MVVAETPEEVAEAVHAYRADVLSDAFAQAPPERQPGRGADHREPPHLSAVEDRPELSPDAAAGARRALQSSSAAPPLRAGGRAQD